MKATLSSVFYIAIFLILHHPANSQFRYTGNSFSTRSEVIAQNGMVATSHPLATQVALDILKKGGSAVDAAIAANAMLGLVEPTGNGIGGDLFAIIWDSKTNKLHGLNASGRSPKMLTKEYFKQNGMSKIPEYGALSVSVPGCVDGWYEMHEKFGNLSMKEILTPTVNYAKEGFPVTEVIGYLWAEYTERLKSYDNFAKLYMPGGNAPRKGEIFRNPELANTIEKIIQEGRDAFYKGSIANTITEKVKREGGFLSVEDLTSHSSEWVEPLSTNYRGFDVWQLPPNGQGIAVLQMLNILEGYDITSYGFGSFEHLHLLIEAKKIAFEDRSVYIADPEFSSIPLDYLISKEYANSRRSSIDIEMARQDYEPGVLEGGSNTIYLTIADRDGNMVSLIQSNFAGMGSGIVPDGLGFSLQNRGSSFSLDDSHLNSYAPQKRPFHTLIPGFVTKNGNPYLSFGLMGGDMQPQGHVQILVNLIDFKMNLQDAGDAPRINHTGSSTPLGVKSKGAGNVRLESGFSSEVIQKLMKRGHTIGYDLRGYGGYQAILYDSENKVYFGASESRKDGHAAGY